MRPPAYNPLLADKAVPRCATLALALAAVALAVAVVSVLRSDGRAPAILPPGEPLAASQPASITALEQRMADLLQRMNQLEAGGSRAEVIDRSRIEAMVDEALAGRGYDARPRSSARKAEPMDAATKTRAMALAKELQGTGADARSAEIWQELRRLGAVDAAVAFFEQKAAANPTSPDAQTQLGAAYVEQMLQATDEQQRIDLGKKIDAQYDRALELQPDHWEARFRKAVGLSYGPDLSGRRSEAIAQFEQLVQQQAVMPAQPGQSATYLYLGRLYQQQGDRQRATAIWQLGLRRHPQDSELMGVLGEH